MSAYRGQWVALHPETYKVLGHGPTPEIATRSVQAGKTEHPLLYLVPMDDTFAIKVILPADLPDGEKQPILERGRNVVAQVRSRTKGIPASVIQQEVDKAVREVRARYAQRGR